MPHEFHTPVLAQEVLYYLDAKRPGIYVDGTLGGGGHAELILKTSASGSRLVGFDRDLQALSFARQRLHEFGNRVIYVHDDFSNMAQEFRNNDIASVDGIVLDLGVSSHQLDVDARGFSFQKSGRLDMRMNQEQGFDAAMVVNTYDVLRLADIFRKYGEERNSMRIARKITAEREKQPIDSTERLSAVVKSAVGSYLLQKSLARIFQAIRIEVNAELEQLREGLRHGFESLKIGGRFVVISYHSLEDRIVKEFFVHEGTSWIRSGNKLLPDLPRQPRLAILTKKPVRPADEETETNPRSRSAKLRAIEKIAA